MMIFNELRKHGRLAAKRHPMYEKNKVAKILGYVMGAFWAGYLIFFGTTFAFGFSDMVPNREPYQNHCVHHMIWFPVRNHIM